MDSRDDDPPRTLAWTVTTALLVVIAVEGLLWTLTRVFILNFDVAGPNATALLVLLLCTGWSLWAVAALPLEGRRTYALGAALAVAGFLLSLASSPLAAGIGAVVLVTAVTPPLAGLVVALRNRTAIAVALGVLLLVTLRTALGTASPYATTLGTALLGGVVLGTATLLVALSVRNGLPETEWGALGATPAAVGSLLVVAAGYLAHPQAVARWALRSYELSVLALVVGVLAGLAVLHGRHVPAGRELGVWLVVFPGSVAVVLVGSHPVTTAALAVAWAAAVVLVAAGCRQPTDDAGAIPLVGVQALAVVALALTVVATHWAFFPSPLDAMQGYGTALTLVLHAVFPLSVGYAVWRGREQAAARERTAPPAQRSSAPVRQSRRSALAVLAAGLAPPAALVGGRTDRGVSEPDETDRIRVMTYNLHLFLDGTASGDYSLPEIRDVIADAGADIVAVSESDGVRPLPGYVDGVRWLGRALGYHTAFGAPSRRRSYGAGLLSRWPITDREVTELPVTRSLTRVALTATVETPEGPLPVLSTHFMTDRDDSDSRAAEAETVVDIAANHDRIIVLGDFNITPGEPEYEILDEAFTDAWVAADRRQGSAGTADLPEPEDRIDYVFLDGGWTVHEAATVGDANASDHRAVVADIERR